MSDAVTVAVDPAATPSAIPAEATPTPQPVAEPAPVAVDALVIEATPALQPGSLGALREFHQSIHDDLLAHYRAIEHNVAAQVLGPVWALLERIKVEANL